MAIPSNSTSGGTFLNSASRLMMLLIVFALSSVNLFAQPGGPGGPPPGGGFPGFPGGPRGPRSDRQMQQTQQKSTTVKQKKNVKAGSTFKVVGSLIDSTKNEPLMYCNVTLLEKEDSSFVKGAVTDANGYFEVKEVPAGEYLLRVSYIGYATRFIPVSVSNNTAMGVINMKAGSAALKTVTITAARPLYAMDGEKMVYNVADDPTIQSGTTEDALQNAPGVEVDVEGNITLRGVSSVEIWVNDKPSKLTSENLKTYLQTLPANALDRIETITNPSAKYATEADAVINIITSAHIKKNHFISFGINGATQPNVSPWLSYTWANERLSINLFTNLRYSTTHGDSWRVDSTFTGSIDSLQLSTIERDSSWNNQQSLNGSIGLHIDYEIDSMSDAGVWGNFNYGNNWGGDSTHHYRYHFGQTPQSYSYRMANDRDALNFFGMFGGNYTKKFDKNGHNLRIFLFGSTNNNSSGSSFLREYWETDTSSYNQNMYKYYDSRSSGTDVSIRSRYNRPYSEKGEMSYGLNFGTDNSRSDYRPYILSEAYVEDGTTLSDDLYDKLRRYVFEEHENEADADVEWTHRFGGFTLQLGMGAKLTNLHFAYTETSGDGDDYTKNFITYNPSIHLSYRTEQMHNFKLNYSLRMRNPSGSDLSTYKKYSEDSYSTGNRDLTQSYTHNAEAGWTKFYNWGSLGLEGYGRLSTGEIDNLTDQTDGIDEIIGRAIQYTMPYNIGNSWRYGTSLNATYRPSGFFNMRLYANLYDYGYSMQYDKLGQDPYEDSKWSYSIRLNMWTKVWNRYQIHASANYTSPTLGLMSTRSARYWVNMGVRADFFNRKPSAFINVQDIFNWGKTIGNATTNTNPFVRSESKSRTLNSRYISAGITLRFGKMELEKNSQSGSEAEGNSSSSSSTTSSDQ